MIVTFIFNNFNFDVIFLGDGKLHFPLEIANPNSVISYINHLLFLTRKIVPKNSSNILLFVYFSRNVNVMLVDPGQNQMRKDTSIFKEETIISNAKVKCGI